jgi:hypothetical protein
MTTQQEFFADVEIAENAPLVISPYGFKKVSFGGKVYLMAITREERVAIDVSRSPNAKTPFEYDDGCTHISNGGCASAPPGHCHGQCQGTFDAVLGFQCYCR